MGWFWGRGSQNDKDPTKSLDPKLKEFLDSQQPRPYIPAQAPPRVAPSKTPATTTITTTETHTDEFAPTPPTVPPESLFPDGRYAHLWSTYNPPQSVQSSSESPIERVVTAHKDRRDYLHRAALENCAFEHAIQQTCFSTGNAAQRAKARMTMCRDETKAFSRCYSLQGKFLQALGYMGTRGPRPRRGQGPSDIDGAGIEEQEIGLGQGGGGGEEGEEELEDERIQMHADKLYHRMMDYESHVADAQRQNKPIPALSSVFNSSRPSPSVDQLLASQPASVRERLHNSLGKKSGGGSGSGGSNSNSGNSGSLADLPPQERELAVRAALQEAKLTHLFSDQVGRYAAEMGEKRRQRQKVLSRLVGEPIGKFVIPDLKEEEKKKKKKKKKMGEGEAG